MKLSDKDALSRAGKNCLKMKNFTFGLCALILAAFGSGQSFAAESEGVALAIIYDTSGSMKDTVVDESGHQAPKYVIANRALMAIAKQVQNFATNSASGTPRTIHAGLFIFDHD